MEQMIDIICSRHTAESISRLSHNVVWENAHIGEELPYYTAVAQMVRSITPDDVEWARTALGGEPV